MARFSAPPAECASWPEPGSHRYWRDSPSDSGANRRKPDCASQMQIAAQLSANRRPKNEINSGCVHGRFFANGHTAFVARIRYFCVQSGLASDSDEQLPLALFRPGNRHNKREHSTIRVRMGNRQGWVEEENRRNGPPAPTSPLLPVRRGFNERDSDGLKAAAPSHTSAANGRQARATVRRYLRPFFSFRVVQGKTAELGSTGIGERPRRRQRRRRCMKPRRRRDRSSADRPRQSMSPTVTASDRPPTAARLLRRHERTRVSLSFASSHRSCTRALIYDVRYGRPGDALLPGSR
jgi:hypothetical protein